MFLQGLCNFSTVHQWRLVQCYLQGRVQRPLAGYIVPVRRKRHVTIVTMCFADLEGFSQMLMYWRLHALSADTSWGVLGGRPLVTFFSGTW